MNTTQLGNRGEDAAEQYLRKDGFKIVGRNVKTSTYEIDIIAQKRKRLYFVEVKARKSSIYGGGLDYITPSKLKQMQFAAEMWVHANTWKGQYQLAALAVDADEVTFIEDLST